MVIFRKFYISVYLVILIKNKIYPLNETNIYVPKC